MPKRAMLPALPNADPTALSEGSANVGFVRLTLEEQQRLAWMLQSFHTSAWRVARRVGLSSALADEIAQESFGVAAHKLASIEPGHERAFVLGVALRLAGNARRRFAYRLEHALESPDAPEPVDGQPLAEETLARKQRCEQLDRILDSMSAVHREVLLLYEVEELTLLEIAEALDIPEGTAASRLRRARVEFSRRVRSHAAFRDGLEET